MLNELYSQLVTRNLRKCAVTTSNISPKIENLMISYGKARELTDPYEALLFDLDGTLVDTMPLHYKAYAEALKGRNLWLTETDFMSAIGEPARNAIPRFLTLAGVKNFTPDFVSAIHREKKTIFERLINVTRIEPLQAAELLPLVRGRKLLGLVSSGNRPGVHNLLAAMGWGQMFSVVVSGDDVKHGKPDPESYLRAAHLIGVEPSKCLVFEDTALGLDAGRAAGMSVVDVKQLDIHL